jgi:hypothetical protein
VESLNHVRRAYPSRVGYGLGRSRWTEKEANRRQPRQLLAAPFSLPRDAIDSGKALVSLSDTMEMEIDTVDL